MESQSSVARAGSGDDSLSDSGIDKAKSTDKIDSVSNKSEDLENASNADSIEGGPTGDTKSDTNKDLSLSNPDSNSDENKPIDEAASTASKNEGLKNPDSSTSESPNDHDAARNEEKSINDDGPNSVNSLQTPLKNEPSENDKSVAVEDDQSGGVEPAENEPSSDVEPAENDKSVAAESDQSVGVISAENQPSRDIELAENEPSESDEPVAVESGQSGGVEPADDVEPAENEPSDKDESVDAESDQSGGVEAADDVEPVENEPSDKDKSVDAESDQSDGVKAAENEPSGEVKQAENESKLSKASVRTSSRNKAKDGDEGPLKNDDSLNDAELIALDDKSSNETELKTGKNKPSVDSTLTGSENELPQDTSAERSDKSRILQKSVASNEKDFRSNRSQGSLDEHDKTEGFSSEEHGVNTIWKESEAYDEDVSNKYEEDNSSDSSNTLQEKYQRYSSESILSERLMAEIRKPLSVIESQSFTRTSMVSVRRSSLDMDESTSRRVETGEGASEPIEQSRSSLKVGIEKTGGVKIRRSAGSRTETVSESEEKKTEETSVDDGGEKKMESSFDISSNTLSTIAEALSTRKKDEEDNKQLTATSGDSGQESDTKAYSADFTNTSDSFSLSGGSKKIRKKTKTKKRSPSKKGDDSESETMNISKRSFGSEKRKSKKSLKSDNDVMKENKSLLETDSAHKSKSQARIQIDQPSSLVYNKNIAGRKSPVASSISTGTELATQGSVTQPVLSVSTFVATSLGSREFPSDHTTVEEERNASLSSVSTKNSLNKTGVGRKQKPYKSGSSLIQAGFKSKHGFSAETFTRNKSSHGTLVGANKSNMVTKKEVKKVSLPPPTKKEIRQQKIDDNKKRPQASPYSTTTNSKRGVFKIVVSKTKRPTSANQKRSSVLKDTGGKDTLSVKGDHESLSSGSGRRTPSPNWEAVSSRRLNFAHSQLKEFQELFDILDLNESGMLEADDIYKHLTEHLPDNKATFDMAEMVLEQFSIKAIPQLTFDEFLYALTLPNKHTRMMDDYDQTELEPRLKAWERVSNKRLSSVVALDDIPIETAQKNLFIKLVKKVARAKMDKSLMQYKVRTGSKVFDNTLFNWFAGQRTAGLSLYQIGQQYNKAKESIRKAVDETHWNSPYAQPLLVDFKKTIMLQEKYQLEHEAFLVRAKNAGLFFRRKRKQVQNRKKLSPKPVEDSDDDMVTSSDSQLQSPIKNELQTFSDSQLKKSPDGGFKAIAPLADRKELLKRNLSSSAKKQLKVAQSVPTPNSPKVVIKPKAFSEFLLRDRKDSIPPKLERIRYSEFVSTTDLVSPPKFPFPQQDVQVSYADKHTITKTTHAVLSDHYNTVYKVANKNAKKFLKDMHPEEMNPNLRKRFKDAYWVYCGPKTPLTDRWLPVVIKPHSTKQTIPKDVNRMKYHR